jgi:hypothetical protein
MAGDLFRIDAMSLSLREAQDWSSVDKPTKVFRLVAHNQTSRKQWHRFHAKSPSTADSTFPKPTSPLLI